jgi:hypothetical protein
MPLVSPGRKKAPSSLRHGLSAKYVDAGAVSNICPDSAGYSPDDKAGARPGPARTQRLFTREVQHVAWLREQVLAGIDEQRLAARQPALRQE